MGARKQSVSLQELIEQGYLEPVKRGRPPLYASDEERRAVHHAQQKECVRRHNERVQTARKLMQQAQAVVESSWFKKVAS